MKKSSIHPWVSLIAVSLSWSVIGSVIGSVTNVVNAEEGSRSVLDSILPSGFFNQTPPGMGGGLSCADPTQGVFKALTSERNSLAQRFGVELSEDEEDSEESTSPLQLLGGLKGVGDLLQKDCGNEAAPDVPAKASCAELSGFDKTQFMKAAESAVCRKTKIAFAQEQIQCLQNAAKTLNQYANNQQSYFQGLFGAMKQDLQSIQQYQAVRTQQMADIQNKLGGDKVSGKPGLRELQAKIREAIDGKDEKTPNFKASINAITTGRDNIAIMKKALTRKRNIAQMQATMQCFKEQPRAKYTCEANANSSSVSAMQKAQCWYYDAQHRNPDGSVIKYAQLDAQATQNSKALGELMEQISRAVEQMPPNAAEISKGASQGDGMLVWANAINDMPAGISTIAGIEKRFGPALEKFTATGFNAKSFVIGNLKTCFQEAKLSVPTYQSDEAEITRREKYLGDSGEQLMKRGAQLWKEGMSSLTGQHLPLPTNVCPASRGQIQVSCLNFLEENLRGLLAGDVEQSKMVMKLSGGGMSEPLMCMGIDGCITALESKSSFIQNEVQKAQQRKQADVAQISKKIEEDAAKVGMSLGQNMSMLHQQLAQLNQALGSIGVQPVKFKEIQAKNLKYEDFDKETKIPVMPDDLLGYLAGKMGDSKLFDLSSGATADAMKSLPDAQKNAQKDYLEVAKAADRFKSMNAECVAQRDKIKSKYKQVSKSMKFTDQCMQAFKGLCSKSENKVGDLSQSLVNILSSFDSAQKGVSEASAGVDGNSLSRILDDDSVTGMLDIGSDLCSKAQESTGQIDDPKVWKSCVDQLQQMKGNIQTISRSVDKYSGQTTK